MRPLLARLTCVLVSVSISPSCSGSTAPHGVDASGPADGGVDAELRVDASTRPLPELVWESCPTGFRDECAHVAMPLNHEDPTGETIDVLISRRGSGSKQLWLLQGGPGASADVFFGLHGFLSMVDPELEVFTIEHRGVGPSTRLGCSAERASSPLGFQVTVDEWPACRDEVVARWGNRLDFFSTTQAARDLEVAIALTRREGVPVYVYGGSYGTFLANRFAVLAPHAADGLILDAPVSPGSQLERWDLQFESVGRRVFGELCPDAPRCAEHLGPDPIAFFDRVIARLREGHCGELGLDLAQWKGFFGLSLMDYNLRNWLPAVIYRLDRCSAADKTALATLLNRLFGGAGGAAGGADPTLGASMGNGDGAFGAFGAFGGGGGGGGKRPPGAPRMSPVLQTHIVLSELFSRDHVDPTEVDRARETNLFFQDAMRPSLLQQDVWPRYAVDGLAARYASTELPVLILAGGDDPSAPPAVTGYGFRDHLTGPHQTFVIIPYGAHTVLTAAGSVGPDMPSCPVQLVRAFLSDPRSALPIDCVERVLHPSFDAAPVYLSTYWGTSDLYD